jgi:hypothetical protein
MRAPRLTAALVAAALGTVALTGCSAAANGSTDPSSFANVSGSAVPVADDVAALCAQIVEQKLSPDVAAATAEGAGYTTRIGSIDGEPQAVTKDLQEDRMTFTVEADVVTECIGG